MVCNVWRQEKMYGPAKRILPSGHDDGPGQEPASTPARGGAARKDSDLEPVSYCSLPIELYEELLNLEVKAVIDCTSGDMQFANACIRAEIPYLGVCWTDHHVEMAYTRLAHVVFKAIAFDKQFKHYDAEIGKLMGAKKTVVDQLKKPPPKSDGGDSRAGPPNKKQKRVKGDDEPTSADLQKQLKELQAQLKAAGASDPQGADEISEEGDSE